MKQGVSININHLKTNKMREYSFQISQKRYNYLLPVLREKLLFRVERKIDKYYFIGTYEAYKDALNRCKYLD